MSGEVCSHTAVECLVSSRLHSGLVVLSHTTRICAACVPSCFQVHMHLVMFCVGTDSQVACVYAAVLNLFGGILIQKRRAEVALENSGLNYVIVRPGGMERPTDSYKETHNVRLSRADTLFGGQVRLPQDQCPGSAVKACVYEVHDIVLTAQGNSMLMVGRSPGGRLLS